MPYTATQQIQAQVKHSEHKYFKRWYHMMLRCHDPFSQNYSNYGGRGIYVYEPWRNDFLAYATHIDLLPKNGNTVDRIDNDQGYFPGNLRWTTMSVQNMNKRPRKSLRDAEPTLLWVFSKRQWRVISEGKKHYFDTKPEALTFFSHEMLAFHTRQP